MHIRDHCNIKQLWYARTQTTIMKKNMPVFYLRIVVQQSLVVRPPEIRWNRLKLRLKAKSMHLGLPETNMASETMASQKENHLPTINFRGHVSFRDGKGAFFPYPSLLFQIASTIFVTVYISESEIRFRF